MKESSGNIRAACQSIVEHCDNSRLAIKDALSLRNRTFFVYIQYFRNSYTCIECTYCMFSKDKYLIVNFFPSRFLEWKFLSDCTFS